MQLELVVFHRGAVRTIPLPERGVVGIGRDREQAVHIDDPSVSRRHATLTIEPNAISIEDEGSVNGTVLMQGEDDEASVPKNPLASTSKASVPVRGPQPMQPGDSLHVGAAVLLLRQVRVSQISTAMSSLQRMIDQIAPSPIRVLLIGETGVGKEVLTEQIHARSPRANQPLVKLHCAALSETLLESELFGHERGAFTGAVRSHVGLIETAHGGTLFLDEVGEMPLATQVKLLRVLEDGKVQRVGATTPREVDVRIVSATHRDLAREVKAGHFRQDLYFRLNGITLRVPPLRERREEIEPLARVLLTTVAKRANREPPELGEDALAKLSGHHWPGNVRELRQVMERALALCTADVIDADHILIDEPAPSSTLQHSGGTLRESLENVERKRIEEALAACGGNQSRAAEMLGMPRRTLVERLRSWGLTRPRR